MNKVQPTSAMPWVKLYTRLIDDARLATLDSSAQLIYFKMLMLAGRLDAGGALIEAGQKLTDESIAWKLRADVDSVKQAIKALRKNGLLKVNGYGVEVTGFIDEQGPTHSTERAAWRERQQRRRETFVTGDNPIVTEHTPIVTGDIPIVTTLEEEKIKSQSQRILSSSSDDLKKQVLEFYTHEFGKPSDPMTKRITDACDLYTTAWVMDALLEAVSYNKKSFAYADAILKRWKAEGKVKTNGGKHVSDSGKGNHKRVQQSKRGTSDYSEADRAAAARVKSRRSNKTDAAL